MSREQAGAVVNTLYWIRFHWNIVVGVWPPGRGAVTFTHDLDVSPCSSFRLELVHVNLSGHSDVPQMIKGQDIKCFSVQARTLFSCMCVTAFP